MYAWTPGRSAGSGRTERGVGLAARRELGCDQRLGFGKPRRAEAGTGPWERTRSDDRQWAARGQQRVGTGKRDDSFGVFSLPGVQPRALARGSRCGASTAAAAVEV